MKDFELEVKNYRCFPDSHPLRLRIGPGFTSFVGINNSGKSAILRFFWEFVPLLEYLSRGNIIAALTGDKVNIGPRTSPGEQAFSILNTRDIEVRFKWISPPLIDPTAKPVTHDVLITVARDNDGYTAAISLANKRITVQRDAEIKDRSHLHMATASPIDLGPFFDACRFMANAIYLGAFRNTINVGAEGRYYDIAVGQQFVQEFHTYKPGSDPKANEAIHQLIQDIQRIFGFADFDINASPDQKTLQVFIDGRSFRLSELGTGMAQFIIVLANALVRRPSVVLIDEPETGLHPTLQLDLLTTLASYSTNGSVIFATHNLGLARAASEWLYSCRRLEFGVSEVRDFHATPRLAEFLGELGFSAYQDLGHESVLLVEGPADVKTVQQFLRWYKKDHKVVLLSLGGNSMINGNAETELAEVTRISPKVAVIIDSERKAAGADLSPDRAAFVEICKRLNITSLVLERRAIENYVTDDAVKLALGHGYQALEPFQALRGGNPPWGKRDTWRVARQMKPSDLAGTDLGAFLPTL